MVMRDREGVGEREAENPLFLSRTDMTFPLHLQISRPSTVLTVKSSPDSENTFSFICRVSWLGEYSAGFGGCGPSGGLHGTSWWTILNGRVFVILACRSCAVKCFDWRESEYQFLGAA